MSMALPDGMKSQGPVILNGTRLWLICRCCNGNILRACGVIHGRKCRLLRLFRNKGSVNGTTIQLFVHIEAITSDRDEFAVNTILNEFPSLFQQQGILNTLKWKVRFE